MQDEYQEIYLAIKDEVYNTFFQRKSIQVLVKLNQLALLVVNIEKEEIVQWTS
ncbi:MAG: element excision factor XisH family protein [Pseudanabaena sp.]